MKIEREKMAKGETSKGNTKKKGINKNERKQENWRRHKKKAKMEKLEINTKRDKE